MTSSRSEERFLGSAGGRLASGTIALALAAGSAQTLLGPHQALTVACLAPVLCIAGISLSVGLSLERFWPIAAGMMIAFPMVGPLYIGALFTLSSASPMVGALLGAAALASLSLALTGGKVLPRRRPSGHRHGQPVVAS